MVHRFWAGGSNDGVGHRFGGGVFVTMARCIGLRSFVFRRKQSKRWLGASFVGRVRQKRWSAASFLVGGLGAEIHQSFYQT